MDEILIILEIIGTIAFAVSGAFVAIKAKFDIFGVIVVGCVTAVGGGITRDVLIGSLPPVIFDNGYLVAIAACTSLIVFVVAYFKNTAFNDVSAKVDKVNNIFDAVGLAAFTVMGTEVAFMHSLSENCFLTVTLGVLTGVGGGLLRDFFTENLPSIFKKYVYALASIGGAILYYLIRNISDIAAVMSGMIFIITIRLLATKFRWSLPKVNLEQKELKGLSEPDNGEIIKEE